MNIRIQQLIIQVLRLKGYGVKNCVYKAHTNITARVGFLYFI